MILTEVLQTGRRVLFGLHGVLKVGRESSSISAFSASFESLAAPETLSLQRLAGWHFAWAPRSLSQSPRPALLFSPTTLWSKLRGSDGSPSSELFRFWRGSAEPRPDCLLPPACSGAGSSVTDPPIPPQRNAWPSTRRRTGED